MSEDLSTHHQMVSDLFEKLQDAAAAEPFRLTDEQIQFYHDNGYLAGVRVFSDRRPEDPANGSHSPQLIWRGERAAGCLSNVHDGTQRRTDAVLHRRHRRRRVMAPGQLRSLAGPRGILESVERGGKVGDSLLENASVNCATTINPRPQRVWDDSS